MMIHEYALQTGGLHPNEIHPCPQDRVHTVLEDSLYLLWPRSQ